MDRRMFLAAGGLVGVGGAGLGGPLVRRMLLPQPQNNGKGMTVTVAIDFAADGELREQILDFGVRNEMRNRFNQPHIQAAVRDKKKPGVVEEEESPIYHPNHTPIVLQADDVLEWQCHPAVEPFDFVVSMAKNPAFRDVKGAPHNPFGWDLPVSGGKGRSVRGLAVKDQAQRAKIRDQFSFKFSIYAKGKVLDPDTIVDF